MKVHFTSLTRIGSRTQSRQTDPSRHQVELHESGWVGIRDLETGEVRLFPSSQIEFLEASLPSSDGRMPQSQVEEALPSLPPSPPSPQEPPQEPPRRRPGRPRKEPQ
jgi:hypothetical protein